jgi:hypothetical protein
MREGAYPLLAPDEDRSAIQARENLWADVADIDAIEARCIAAGDR